MTKNYDSLDNFVFVFPNKRSGTFFLKYLRELTPERSISPQITSIQEFVSDLSGCVIDTRLDLLFLLFSEYRKIVGEENARFDKFRTWGEMVLSDFNDVDMYEADARSLFRNLANLREIKSNFLTDEQKEVLKEYFGIETEDEASSSSFWQHYNNGDRKDDDSRSRFLELWQVLGELYERLGKRLSDQGLAYPGMAYRKALSRLREEGTEALSGYRKVVMIGFNALSSVEFHIFKELLRLRDPEDPSESFGDFYWDCTGLPMADKTNSAVHFMQKNIKFFPSIHSISESDYRGLPSVIKSIASPGASAQAKIASGLVADIASRVGEKTMAAAKVAVVLPDENMLLPLLYSLPEGLKDVNLTMGYSVKLTSTASYVKLLRKLQQRKRYLSGKLYFFHEDVKLVLSHPFAKRVGRPGEASELRRDVARSHKYLLSPEDFNNASEPLRRIFSDFGPEPDGFVVSGYIDNALNDVAESMKSENDGDNAIHELDLSLISLYRQKLAQLMISILKYDIDMSVADVFALADGLLRGESVRFEGQPLKGLQVMGPLETRCLDFDYIIILSMNERVYPRKLRKGSFIPASIRRDNGLATVRFQESIFAYNFYRMISRAREVYMVHDARTEGLKSGDVSRYVLQLRHLYAKDLLEDSSARFPLASSDSGARIRKSKEVMESLYPFLEPEGKRFSASALKAYISCPMKFYLEYVHGVREDQEPEEFMQASMLGNIMHGVLQNLYTPDKGMQGRMLSNPVSITKERLNDLLSSGNGELDRAICRMINREYYRLDGSDLDKELGSEGKVYFDVFRSIAERVLRHDLELAPFDILGTEISETVRLPLSDGSMVNMKYIIDRLDTAGRDENGNPAVRVVDYKTGYFKLKFDSVEDMFTSGSGLEALFQLMLYSRLLRVNDGIDGPIAMEIYDLRKLGTPASEKDGQLPVLSGNVLLDYREVDSEFSDRLDQLLCEILSEEGYFHSMPSESGCKFCAFKTLCRR